MTTTVTIVCILISFCILLLILLSSDSPYEVCKLPKDLKPPNYAKPNSTINSVNETNILDGCYHVYLDIGSNIGVQVRKLFEPEKYPNAKVAKVFRSNFGTDDERKLWSNEDWGVVCAIGFEPNPHHTKNLADIETHYNNCGWRVKFMTETAVSNHSGTTHFYSDNNYRRNEWGGGILSPDINREAKVESTAYLVTLVRLSDFLKNVVGQRKIPNSPPNHRYPPKIIMKMDIEGSETDVIPDILFTGGLQYVNAVMIEWHTRLEKLEYRATAQRQLRSIIELLSKYSTNTISHGVNNFEFNVVYVDDESYGNSNFELPNCQGGPGEELSGIQNNIKLEFVDYLLAHY